MYFIFQIMELFNKVGRSTVVAGEGRDMNSAVQFVSEAGKCGDFRLRQLSV